MEVYNKAGFEVDIRNKARLLYLLRTFPAGEPTRKRFVSEMVGYVITRYWKIGGVLICG